MAECSASTLLLVALLSTLPGLEGRYAVAAGLACMPAAALVAYASSTATGIAVYALLARLEAMIARLPRLWGLYEGVKRRLSRRLGGRRGAAALAAFVAIPLPGSGVWTGALAARLLGLGFAEAAAAIAIGNLAAVLATSVAGHAATHLLG